MTGVSIGCLKALLALPLPSPVDSLGAEDVIRRFLGGQLKFERSV